MTDKWRQTVLLVAGVIESESTVVAEDLAERFFTKRVEDSIRLEKMYSTARRPKAIAQLEIILEKIHDKMRTPI